MSIKLKNISRKNEASVDEMLNSNDEDVQLSQDQLKLLEQGRQDTTTSVSVTVTVYTTQSFR